MKYWTAKFRTVQEDGKNVKAGILAANNHYTGFGAKTANMFRVMSGIQSVEWGVSKVLDYDTE